MRLTPTRVVLLAAASSTLTGCFLWTTRSEGDQLLEEAMAREERLTALEEGSRRNREELAEQVGRAKAQVAELEIVLKKATQVVTRNSADLGLEVERLRERLDSLNGQIAELRNQLTEQQRQLQEERAETQRRLAQLSQKVGLDVELDPSDIPEDREEHYATAYRAYQAAEHSRARALFRAYVDRYTRDDEKDNALYWIGMTYLQQDRPATALGEFRRVLSDHSTSDAVDETLLAMADAFYRLNACGDSRDALEALIRGQPGSPLVGDARRKLREVQRAPRGYCRE